MESLATARRIAAVNSLSICMVQAFSLAGRLSVTVATDPVDS
jgi:hypothetical protein